MKFILSRTDDREVHSKKWIVGYGLLFWIVSRIFAMLQPGIHDRIRRQSGNGKEYWIPVLCVDDGVHRRSVA